MRVKDWVELRLCRQEVLHASATYGGIFRPDKWTSASVIEGGKAFTECSETVQTAIRRQMRKQ